jgi:hypothetical protein
MMVALGPAIIRIAEAPGAAAVAAAGLIDRLSRIPALLGLMGPQPQIEALDHQIDQMHAAGRALADELNTAITRGNPTEIAAIRQRVLAHLDLLDVIQRERDALGPATPAATPPTVPAAGAVPRDPRQAAAAQREAERLAEQQARLRDRQNTEDRRAIEAIDPLIKASHDYNRTLVDLADARAHDNLSTEEQIRLQGRASESFRTHALAAVGLTEAFKNQSEGAELLRDRISTLNTLLRTGAVTADEYANLMRRATAEASLGAEGWKNFVKASEGVASGITDGLEAALLKAKSVREALADIVTEIQKVLLHELVMAPIRAAISSGVQSLGSWAFGSTTAPTSVGIGHAPIQPAAAGGIASAATVAMVGEGTDPEAIIPMPGGRGVPVVMKGGAGMQANAVFNIDASNADVGVERRIMTALRAYEPGLVARLMDQARRGGTFAKAFGRA